MVCVTSTYGQKLIAVRSQTFLTFKRRWRSKSFKHFNSGYRLTKSKISRSASRKTPAPINFIFRVASSGTREVNRALRLPLNISNRQSKRIRITRLHGPELLIRTVCWVNSEIFHARNFTQRHEQLLTKHWKLTIDWQKFIRRLQVFSCCASGIG